MSELLDQGLAHHQAGRLREAEQVYQEVLRASPLDANALHLLGLVHHHQGRHEAALGNIGRALDLQPDSAVYWANLSAVYAALARDPEAADAAREAIRLNPNHDKAYCNLGCALQALGDLDGAAASFRCAVQINPKYVKAHSNLGTVLYAQGKLDEAESSLREALKINPNHAEAHSNLGAVLRAQGRWDEAVREATESIEIAGIRRPVSYPDTGNTGVHIQHILSGADYPVIPLDGFTPRIIIDVGANVGATALYFLSQYPSSRVLCFEPAPLNIEYLRRNTGFTDKIEVFPYGLYSETTVARLYGGKTQCMQYSIYPGPEVTEKSTQIELHRAFDELQCISESPWLLKVDVEGAELAVLKSIEPLLEHIGIIYLEYHSEQERLALDALLTTDFMLWRSSAKIVHRGNVAYVAKRYVTGQHGLAVGAIEPQEPG
jgi:FkbM family methyltransferase